MSDYHSLLKRLFSINQGKKVKLGLDVSLCLHEAVGRPLDTFSSIHIAGTNGKGSVSTKIAEALHQEGFRVGLFTSPHIAAFRERIRVDGAMITEEEMEKSLSKLFALGIDATFFELATIMAFDHFRNNKVTHAVIETGLGGRLDATNIVRPIVSVITSIGLDHTAILGNTLEEIALEKAGIIKQGVPVVIGPRVPFGPIKEKANVLECPLHSVEGPHENYEIENRSIARRALELMNISGPSIEKGIDKCPSCRFEHYKDSKSGVTVIMDAAHNEQGLEALFQRIKKTYSQIPVVGIVGFSKGKDPEAALSIVSKHCEAIHLVEASNGREIPVAELGEILSGLKHFQGIQRRHASISKGVEEALRVAKKRDAILLICGTFFIMASARRTLGIIEPCDFIDMNERF